MSSTRAQEAFAEFLEQSKRGECPSFEAFCAAHVEVSEELQKLHEAWKDATLVDDSFFKKLKDQLGDNVDPGISLDREPGHGDAGDTAALIDKVAQMTAARRYSIKGEVARGGMGMIYKVWDRDLRRNLAMKVVLGKDGSPQEGSSAGVDRDRLGRFLEEAQITGQLDHPGIVPVHELGMDSDGRVYFTMRLVRGKELREIIDEFRSGESNLSLMRMIHIVVRVCESMAFAHEKGVVHRDLKPANIMVGRFGEVYVMDWGLAKVMGRDEKPASSQTSLDMSRTFVGTDRTAGGEMDTMEGSVFGTPCYMAPEQARGQVDRIGPWSDVYSVGSILYHLLTGTMPYVPSGDRMHPHAVLGMLLQGPPRPIRECEVKVPDELAAICEKAMERDPEQRYTSMVEMGEDLQAFLEGRVVQAHATGAAAEFKKWVVRNKGMAASLAGLAVVLVGGSIGFAWHQKGVAQQLHAEQQATLAQKAVAEDNEREAQRQSYVANLIAADVNLRTNEVQEAKRRLSACLEELRGWEWQHVSIKADSSVASLPHPEAVLCVAADADFFRIATGGPDTIIRLWSPDSPTAVATLSGHSDPVVDLAFDPDGRRLASASDDGTVRIWDPVAERNLHSLRGHSGAVKSVAYGPEGARLVSGGLDYQVFMWDADTGGELWAIEASDQPVGAVAFAPDGRRVASGSDDGMLKIWSAEDGTPAFEIVAHPAPVTDLAYSPDGAHIATTGLDGTLRVWDAESGERLVDVPGQGDAIFCLAFSPVGDRIVTGSLDKSLRIVDAATGVSGEPLNGHEMAVRAVAFSGDGSRLVSTSDDGTARLWAADVGGAGSSLSVGPEPVAAITFAPDGRRLAASSAFTGNIRIWDAPSASLLVEIPGRDEGVNALAFDPRGDWLVAGLNGFTVLVFDARTGKPRIDPMTAHDASISGVDVSPDGLRIASSSADQTVRLWDSASGAPVAILTGHGMAATCVSFAPDGERIAAGAFDGVVKVWDVGTEEVVLSLVQHTDAVRSVAYSPDGALLASASHDGTVRLWDAATGAAGRVLAAHEGLVYSLAFSPDGSRLVSSSFDKTLLLWEVASGTPLLTLRGHHGPVPVAAFSPDGARLASGSFDGSVLVWETLPSARRFRAQRAAELVEGRLIELGGRMDHVEDSVRGDASIDEGLRAEALEIVSLRGPKAVPAAREE